MRAGLILGPREDVGRLTWWLARMARGGEILCPGPPGQPLQYIDARDLAGFALDPALAGRSGPFNVVSRRGHATMGSLLESCRPVQNTVRDTWQWLWALGAPPPLRQGASRAGLAPERERAVLEAQTRAYYPGCRCGS